MREIYTIEQGNQYANGINFKPNFWLKEFIVEITPDENCLYDIGSKENQDINKFYGVKWGTNNDFRIGWNCFKQNGMIQYYHYSHNHGVRNPDPNDPPLKTFLIDGALKQKKVFKVKFNRSQNRIEIWTPSFSAFSGWTLMENVNFNFDGVSQFGLYSFFYFGGNIVSPHLMSATICQL